MSSRRSSRWRRCASMPTRTDSGTPVEVGTSPEEGESLVIVTPIQKAEAHSRVQPAVRIARGRQGPLVVALRGKVLRVRQVGSRHGEEVFTRADEERSRRRSGPHPGEGFPREPQVLVRERRSGHRDPDSPAGAYPRGTLLPGLRARVVTVGEPLGRTTERGK